MSKEIFQYLQKLSSLHVMPYYKWAKNAIQKLDALLDGIPYCITPHGDVFLGEQHVDDIKPGRVCLQAHLDHPGGILYADRQAQYLFAKYYGTHARLRGYTLGVYEPGKLKKIDQLEIEDAVFQESDQATCFFFKSNQKLFEALPEKTFVVHHDAPPDIKDEMILNWSLDDLINCALIVALMKKKDFSDNLYGLLSVNEEVPQGGIREFLSNIADKHLFLVNLDVIDNMLQLKTLDDEPYQQQYGIRFEQSGVKLDSFLFPELIKDVGRDYLAKIPTGQCEGHVMQKMSNPFMAVFLKIDHYHNGIQQKKFTAERLALEDLSRYMDFVENTVEKMREHINPNRISLFIASSNMPEPPGTIHIVDHVEAIKDMFYHCQTFPEYLYTGIPKLRAIYDRYNIPLPNITMENFESVKENILRGEFPKIQVSQVYFWKEKILVELNRLFDHNALIRDKLVTLVYVLLGNFNARHILELKSIFLSLERISEHELDRVLIHELTHYLTADFWSSQNLSTLKKQYYNEGLAVAISQKLSNSTLAEALSIEEKDLATYLENRTRLKTWFEEYVTGNICFYVNGKYHQYFQKKKLLDPFLANGHQYQRYGYVLAALETIELMKKGAYYEHLFC